jgi:putative ATP-dependent endonuclease of OLD family
VNVPTIYKLTIDRFRCIPQLSWWPAKGVNVILGGGDVGKTTILEAIALLFGTTNPSALSDTDYHGRAIEDGFQIEAIVSLPPQSGINHQLKASWPWVWDGKEACVPGIEEGDNTGEPVYRFRVRGTAELEIIHEVAQPDDTADTFSPTLRRSIGLVRLGGEDRNDRDLRLVQGSALDRLLSDKALRSRLGAQLAKSNVRERLLEEKKKALSDLNVVFTERNLPNKLDLAITGAQGQSITALIGLTAKRGDVELPLVSWGAGTRRFAALAIAEQNQGEAPITLVDEVERGLEPYRQRYLMDNLQAGNSQVFLTTHSPSALAAASLGTVWYLDRNGVISELASVETARHREADPEAFLSRLTIVAEGATELGFVTSLIEKALGAPLQKHGVHVTDGGGHESTLGLLEALAAGGLMFAGIVDDEGKYPVRWQRLSTGLGTLLLRWDAGCTEQNVIGVVPENRFEELVSDPRGDKTGARLRTLAIRLGLKGEDKDFATIKQHAGPNLKPLIIAAACGTVPEGKEAEKRIYKSHAQDWFKSIEGGRELFGKVVGLGIWQSLKPKLLPFCNAIRNTVDLVSIADISI